MGMSKLIPLLFLFAIGCRLTMKNTIQVPYGECSKENAEKIALHRYDTKGNKSGYDIEVNKTIQHSANYFVEIYPVFETKYEVIDGETEVTMLAGGGALYTIDKKTCKIVDIVGYE